MAFKHTCFPGQYKHRTARYSSSVQQDRTHHFTVMLHWHKRITPSCNQVNFIDAYVNVTYIDINRPAIPSRAP